MTNQIERLQAQFYSLNIDLKREFIEHLQDKLQYNNDPEWRAYIQPFISRCIMEYNEEIKRPVATATYGSAKTCVCGYQLTEDDKYCDNCGQPQTHGYPQETGRYQAATPPAPSYHTQAPTPPVHSYPTQAPIPPVSAPTYHQAHEAPQAPVLPPMGGLAPTQPPVAPPLGGTVPSQAPQAPTFGAPSNPQNKLDDTLSNITNAIPVAGNTVLYVTSILLVILGGIGLMVNVLMPLEALQMLDNVMSLVGLTWLQLYMLEGGLIIFRLIVGVMGIVCSMRPDIARRCRTLGIALFSYRAAYQAIVWFAMMDLPREVTAAARGSNMFLNILGWILPLVYILAAHKAIGASVQSR